MTVVNKEGDPAFELGRIVTNSSGTIWHLTHRLWDEDEGIRWYILEDRSHTSQQVVTEPDVDRMDHHPVVVDPERKPIQVIDGRLFDDD